MKSTAKGITRERAIEHWERVLRTSGLPPASYEAAREALEVLRGKDEGRTPGGDDA